MAKLTSANRISKPNGHAKTVAAQSTTEVTPNVIQAILRGLGKVETAPLQPGKYQIQGFASVRVNCWLTKGQPTTVRQAVPSTKILALALEMACNQGLNPEQVAALISAAATEVAKGTTRETATVDAAIESLKSLMPSAPREGSTLFAGEVEIVNFEED
jgi:hypothetical protein